LPALAHRPHRRATPRKHRGYRRVVRRASWGRPLYNYFRDYDATTGRYIQSDPIGLAAGVNTYTYTLNNPVTFSDQFGTNVTMTCRPLRNVGISSARHCGVIVWHWSKDCPPKKIIDRQFSTPGWSTGPTSNTHDPTYIADQNSFNNPGGVNTNYEIPVPESMTSNQFDAAVIGSGDSFHNPYYLPWGPNSNTAAAGIIIDAGGTVPNVPGAFGEFWTPPPVPVVPRF
jgi:RHS repeat-associated protein